jgi:hypothetical protein
MRRFSWDKLSKHWWLACSLRETFGRTPEESVVVPYLIPNVFIRMFTHWPRGELWVLRESHQLDGCPRFIRREMVTGKRSHTQLVPPARVTP